MSTILLPVLHFWVWIC